MIFEDRFNKLVEQIEDPPLYLEFIALPTLNDVKHFLNNNPFSQNRKTSLLGIWAGAQTREGNF